MNNILIVDDDPVALQFVKTILKNEGYGVHLAKDGDEALQKIKKEHFDIIISDVNMPASISGFELAKTVRAQNSQKRVFIILLTGRREKADVRRGVEAGIDDYLVKPVNPDLLLKKINRLLWQKEGGSPDTALARAPVQGRCSLHLNAHIVSLSEQGITIKSEVDLAVDSPVTIASDLFAEMGVRIPALKVVNSYPDITEDGSCFKMRLHFIDLSAMDTQKIRNWINSHHVGSDGHGKFKRA